MNIRSGAKTNKIVFLTFYKLLNNICLFILDRCVTIRFYLSVLYIKRKVCLLGFFVVFVILATSGNVRL